MKVVSSPTGPVQRQRERAVTAPYRRDFPIARNSVRTGVRRPRNLSRPVLTSVWLPLSNSSPENKKESRHSHFNRCILPSLNLFFGNMPLTARRKTSPPPHFSRIFSIVISFRLPGRVVCE